MLKPGRCLHACVYDPVGVYNHVAEHGRGPLAVAKNSCVISHTVVRAWVVARAI